MVLLEMGLQIQIEKQNQLLVRFTIHLLWTSLCKRKSDVRKQDYTSALGHFENAIQVIFV